MRSAVTALGLLASLRCPSFCVGKCVFEVEVDGTELYLEIGDGEVFDEAAAHLGRRRRRVAI